MSFLCNVQQKVSTAAVGAHESPLYTEGPEAELVKSSRFTSCLYLILTFLHANSIVMERLKQNRLFKDIKSMRYMRYMTTVDQ